MIDNRIHGAALSLAIAAIATILLLMLAGERAEADPPVVVSLPALPTPEQEPNGTAATAQPIADGERVRGRIQPGTDLDLYAFTATPGDRVYAATGTSASPADTNTVLTLRAPDGATVIETDSANGSFSTSSSSIAGAAITVPGTHFIEVKSASNGQILPYDLLLDLRTGAPTPEVEPNDAAAGTPLPPSGHVSGSTSAASDVDRYSISLEAGDTLFASLDADPERDATEWNPRLAFGSFAGGNLLINDAGAAGPDSEAFFATVKDSGTYSIQVDAAMSFGTYELAVEVIEREQPSCRTYSAAGPMAIPDSGSGPLTVPINVVDNFRIARAAIDVNLTHANPPDLDLVLRSPQANDLALFTDPGSPNPGTHDYLLDKAAAWPPAHGVFQGLMLQPRTATRLEWLEGEQAAGTWELVVHDDTPTNTGTLDSWGLILCEAPDPNGTLIYSEDFEADGGGFTHSGPNDEWEHGTPAFAPITTCASGTKCWKTDLDNTYNAGSVQDLVSPPISLAGVGGPITLSWAQRFQLEGAAFDHFTVEVRQVGMPATAKRIYEWNGPTMSSVDVGPNPPISVLPSAGWGRVSAPITQFAGQQVEVVFHVDSDLSAQFAGVAIDDLAVRGPADSDGDGLLDPDDDCPTGIPGLGGDTDGDGCKDPEDGDDDNDGVPDGSDGCPVGAASGPDADGDGCKDSEDADDDNDGVPDSSDACPNEVGPGPGGCPKPTPNDSDGDGTPDSTDACVAVGGATANGCPDLTGGLTLKYKASKQLFKGRLTPPGPCAAAREVAIFKTKKKAKKLGVVTTTGGGRFTLGKKARPGDYFAKSGEITVASAGNCLAVTSKTLTIEP